jgi:hypothetical protein
VDALLGPRVSKLENTPRALARARESIRLCAESDRTHRQGMRDFLRAPPTVTGPRPTR